MIKRKKSLVAICGRYSSVKECARHYCGMCNTCIFLIPPPKNYFKPYIKPWCYIK